MMRSAGQCLGILGSRGPFLLLIALMAGTLFPPVAAAAYELLPLSAFLLTAGSFLSAALSAPEENRGWRRLLLALVWIGLGVPVAVIVLLAQIDLEPDLRAAVLLSVLAPPVGSAAALAAMLGLRPRLALITSIALTLLVPVSMPITLYALQIELSGDLSGLVLRLAGIIGGAALLATLVKRWPRMAHDVLPDRNAAAGVAVLGLIIVGLALARGICVFWEQDPPTFLAFLAAAAALNVGVGLLGTLLFTSWGKLDALTVGLVSGNRNITLVWAAAGHALTANAEAFIAASVVPIFALSLIATMIVRVRAQLNWRLATSTRRLRFPAANAFRGFKFGRLR